MQTQIYALLMMTWLFAFSQATDVDAAEPRVETLVPGVSVTRLPVELMNVDSVEYGPDGRLYAAGYDGRIHVLTDTNDDGLEDKVEVFWSKPGDLLTPVGILPTKDGVYVAARGKIALLKDADGDGLADTSETVVSGWARESNNSDTRNDAAGIAIDSDGHLYFSLGCMSYNKAWLVDNKGKSHYDMQSERGTILKVSPDRKHREIVATGLRFVVGLEFNNRGDLFATDQEGDTWFPGGNPRDELLHIIPGRHYGFPFRHPKYLPDIVDEPFVVGFSPQHQSACGFRFNEARANRQPFGPAQWEGNAIVSGFSRGKLWRVPMAKTRAGYVGKQIQIAAFESLLTDVAVSPTGDLLVTGHSGRPDWGAGPAAKGYLYKLTFDRSSPQPVVAWPASPLEVKVAFDRPIDPRRIEMPVIEAGEFVREGDGYEWIFPGYEVVKAAKAAHRRPLKVGSTTVSADGRTVTFLTAPQGLRARYGIKLPGIAARDEAEDQSAKTIELSYDLGGVHAEWIREGDTTPSWIGWLPHIDTNVVRAMTAGSAEHERLLKLVQESGQLTMRSQLLLPGKKVAMRFVGSGAFVVKCGSVSAKSQPDKQRYVAAFTVSASETQPQSDPRGGREQVLPTENRQLIIELQTGNAKGDFLFDVSYHADFDPHERPLRLEHLFVPWAPATRPSQSVDDETQSRELIAGNPEKGREIFFSKEANCATCHAYGGRGGRIAADLTVTRHRTPEAVLRDIVQPSVAINPDYVSYTVVTGAGKTITGLFQTADENGITLVDSEAKTHVVQRDNIEDIRPSSVSLMPQGFDKLGKDKLQDLVAFLCTEDADARKKGLPTGAIQREYWLGTPRGGISGLTGHPNFPDKPSGSGLLSRFEGPVNWKEDFGSRIRGYIHPPKTGNYVFWVAADDHAELWLSTSEKPTDKARIVTLNRWTPSRNWDAYPEQKSKPVRLEAGKRYYIEALQIEATVDDCLAVGWQLPDGTMERPIPGKRLSTIGKKP
jgi:putative heme-binding domain-containing protein